MCRCRLQLALTETQKKAQVYPDVARTTTYLLPTCTMYSTVNPPLTLVLSALITVFCGDSYHHIFNSKAIDFVSKIVFSAQETYQLSLPLQICIAY